MVAKLIARGIRAALDEMGYVLWKKEFLQYGISVYDDIARLNRAWGRSVNTFFDVGANVGQTAREALRRFPSARVYAFEPHPASFLKLVAIKDDRLSAHQIALSERSGKATLYQYGEAGDGSLINSLVNNAHFPVKFGHRPKKEVNIACSTVDDFCREHRIDSIDVLKLDTEGSERPLQLRLHGIQRATTAAKRDRGSIDPNLRSPCAVRDALRGDLYRFCSAERRYTCLCECLVCAAIQAGATMKNGQTIMAVNYQAALDGIAST
jgi:FkbM family methyltransferase